LTEPEPETTSLAAHLIRWEGTWPADDPNAGFKAEVALSSLSDPLPPFEVLSIMTGIPVGALLRFVAVKYMTAGSETLLSVGPSQIELLLDECEVAETADTDAARLEAYERIHGRLRWLASGIDPPDPMAGANAPR
jgi:hypothetical protein